MTPEQTRVHALQFALQMNRDNDFDLNKLFAFSDKISDYIAGRNIQVVPLWSAEKIVDLQQSAENPEYFFDHHVRCLHPIRGAVSFQPYEFQRVALRTIHSNQFTIINHARQMGLSSLLANYALWFASMQPNQTVLILSYRLSAALELVARLRYCLDHLPAHIVNGVKSNTKSHIEFENGSRIVARAINKDALRGLVPSLTIMDGIAYSSHSIIREMWDNSWPLLDKHQSKVVVSSSPGVSDGIFYHLWTAANASREGINASNGFVPLKLTWDMHPDRDDNWAQVMQQQLGERVWRNEFECEFRPC